MWRDGSDGSKMSASPIFKRPALGSKKRRTAGGVPFHDNSRRLETKQDPAMVLYWSNTHIEQRGRLFAHHPLLTNNRKQGWATFSSSFYDYFLTIPPPPPFFFIFREKRNDIHAIGSETSNFPANFILQWHVLFYWHRSRAWKKKKLIFLEVPSGCDSKVCYTRKKECVFSGRSSGWREKGMSGRPN